MVDMAETPTRFAWAALCLARMRLDPLLGGRSPQRSDARIPTGAEFDIRRQAGVDEALGLSDRPFVELGDSGRERLYERI